jgi:hypothetical protein
MFNNNKKFNILGQCGGGGSGRKYGSLGSTYLLLDIPRLGDFYPTFFQSLIALTAIIGIYQNFDSTVLDAH